MLITFFRLLVLILLFPLNHPSKIQEEKKEEDADLAGGMDMFGGGGDGY